MTKSISKTRAHALMRLSTYRGGCAQEIPKDMGPVGRGVYFNMTYRSWYNEFSFNKNIN